MEGNELGLKEDSYDMPRRSPMNRISARILLMAFFLLCSLALHAGDIEWSSGVALQPKTPKIGDTVSFVLTVRAGPQGAKDILVTGGIDGSDTFRQQIAEMRPNSARRLRFSWPAATAGEHAAQFQIVPGSRHVKAPAPLSLRFSVAGQGVAVPQQPLRRPVVRERVATPAVAPQISTTVSPQQATLQGLKQPTCSDAPLPDLVISNVSLSGNGYPGTEHSLGVTVQNSGQCASGIFSVRVEVLEQVPARNIHRTREVDTKGYRSIEPCRSSICDSATMYFNYTLLPDYYAYYDFNILVDWNNGVQEFNEDNNSRERTEGLEVKGPEQYQ